MLQKRQVSTCHQDLIAGWETAQTLWEPLLMAVGLQLQPAPPFSPQKYAFTVVYESACSFLGTNVFWNKAKILHAVDICSFVPEEKKHLQRNLEPLKIHKAIAWMGKFAQECKSLKRNSIF